jgi:hypothetical protein
MIPRMAAIAATVASIAAVLPGCGGVTDHAGADRRAAGRARLAADDLPGSWAATPNGGTVTCPALAGTGGAQRAVSDQFIGEQGSADDVVYVFRNALAAKIQLQPILSGAGRRCIAHAMWDGPAAAVRSATLPVARVGDEVQAARFALPAGTAGLIGVLDVVVVRVGRAGVVVEVAADEAARLDGGLRAAAVAAAVRKLRAALEG